MKETPNLMSQGKPQGRFLRVKVFVGLIGSLGAAIIAISCATVDRVVLAPPMIPGSQVRRDGHVRCVP